MERESSNRDEDTWDIVAGMANHATNQHSLKDLTLSELTQRVNDLHATVQNGVRTTLIAAKDCGAALLQCKMKVGHGNWTAWLKENFTASEYTAQRYIRIARDWHLLENNGFLDGPDRQGVAMADEMIRSIHGGREIPSSNKPPLPTRQEWVKNITGTIKRHVEMWPDEAIELFEAEIMPVMDSIEVYMQEQFSEEQYPDILPQIAIRETVGQMTLIRAFVARMGELNEEEQAQLLRLLDKPGALREAAQDNGTPPPGE